MLQNIPAQVNDVTHIFDATIDFRTVIVSAICGTEFVLEDADIITADSGLMCSDCVDIENAQDTWIENNFNPNAPTITLVPPEDSVWLCTPHNEYIKWLLTFDQLRFFCCDDCLVERLDKFREEVEEMNARFFGEVLLAEDDDDTDTEVECA